MAATKPSARRDVAARTSPKRGSLLWLLGLGCGLLMTMATPTALLGAVLLAPALVALVLDDARGKPTARPLILLGLAAAARPLATLWSLGNRMDAALELLGDPTILATAWGAQAATWLVVELAPLFITLALEAAAAARAVRLRAARKHYEEQWDVPPAA
jgi:hypothetical protein